MLMVILFGLVKTVELPASLYPVSGDCSLCHWKKFNDYAKELIYIASSSFSPIFLSSFFPFLLFSLSSEFMFVSLRVFPLEFFLSFVLPPRITSHSLMLAAWP